MPTQLAIPVYETGAAPPCWTSETGTAVFAFSTRLGGVSAAPFDSLNLGRSTADDSAAVIENRRRLLVRLRLDPARLATAGQVHGTHVARALSPELHPETDALVTTEPGLAIAVTTADCMPIVYLTDGAVAVAHSGWRGTAAGMPAVALDAICVAAGVAAARVQVLIGPFIRVCCYRVGSDVARRFPPAARQLRDGAWHVDLAAAARLDLARRGLAAENFCDLGECTACRPQRYFSHRGSGGVTGRQWAVAALIPRSDPDTPRPV